VPTTGPVIFVANHTSAFMDPIVIALYVHRELFFLARGEAFANSLASKVLRTLNMIPIYRPEISPDEIFKNEQIFQTCYDHLSDGNCIMAFPEGYSKTQRRLQKLKTGTARIALGAEAQNSFELGLTILPIGINYSNPHSFQSDLFINFGSPIKVSEYAREYLEHEFTAARKLTDDMKAELENRTVVIQHEELEHLIRNIEKIYREDLRELSDQHLVQNIQNFYVSKEIVNAVTYFYKRDKRRVLKASAKIDQYMEGLKHVKLRDKQLRKKNRRQNIYYRLLFLIFTFPVFLFGYINNYLPFKTAKIVSAKMVKRKDFRGSLQVSMGLLSFLIFYLLQTILIAVIFNTAVALAYIFILYPFGLFTLRYIKEYYKLRKRITFFDLFMKRSDSVARLGIQRQLIIDELEKGKNEYLKAMEAVAPIPPDVH